VFSLGNDFTASGSFVTIVLLPNVAAQLAHGTAEGWVLGSGMAIFLALLLLEGRTLAQRMTELLRLRHENAAIAEQRHRALLLAEHSSQTKSRFLATVSHEIRTPLNGILGMAQLLQKEVATPELRSRVDVVAKSARHLQVLIGDLIDLSRIEAGRLRLEPVAVVLRDVVREVTELQGAVAAEKGLRFGLRIEPDVPQSVIADAPRVKQVLHNLLGNAIKFTPHGEVALAVTVVSAGSLHFTVRDSGPGVDPALRERIFRPFEQTAAASRVAGSAGKAGLGLGLTISRQLARAMGGDVLCLPADGSGACFRFAMPCRPVDGEAAAPGTAGAAAEVAAAAVAAIATGAAAEPGPASSAVLHADDGALHGRVLVAEDNDVNAIIVQTMLERFGLAVERVADGQEALAALQAAAFDLVLMDCQMPGLDGLETTQEWRRCEKVLGRARTPIVALTANAVVGDRDRCLRAGMDDYLVKPIELTVLLRVLRARLRQEAPA
jgi:signal transduction histidine kinase/ActR/RegA family two-component response regulator